MEKNHLGSFSIFSPEGMEVEILNFGATIRSIKLPQEQGSINIALGYRNLEDYIDDKFYIGSTVGRFANRIAGGRLTIKGKEVQLPVNNADNHLHGGPLGFSKRYWTLLEHTKSTLVLGLSSKDGDQGYPGNLQAKAIFSAEKGARLLVEYQATTDKATPVSLSSHTYFNLNGFSDYQNPNALVDNHEIKLKSQYFTPVNVAMIPTGEVVSVAGTTFDFKEAGPLDGHLCKKDRQLELANGFDHNFVIEGAEDQLRFVGDVYSPDTSVKMQIFSNQPGVQFYTGNYLDCPFRARSGLCLETQSFPDAPNQPDFPNAILEPGESYSARTVFGFERAI